MTKVVVEAGICGFTIAVEVVRLSARRVRVSVASECDMVSEMNNQLGGTRVAGCLGATAKLFSL